VRTSGDSSWTTHVNADPGVAVSVVSISSSVGSGITSRYDGANDVGVLAIMINIIIIAIQRSQTSINN